MAEHPAGQRLTREEVENCCKLGSASAFTALRHLDEATTKGRTHNMPAMPNGPCNCSLSPLTS